MKQLRDAAWERCKGFCEKCGRAMNPYDWALHHRKLRSQGGKDEIANVLAVHHKCHNLGTQSIHLNPMASTNSGHLCPSWANPTAWSLTLPDGRQVCLTEEGTYQPTDKKADSNGW